MMQSTRSKTVNKTKPEIQPNNSMRFHMVLAGVGFIGVVVSGLLMGMSSALVNETFWAVTDEGSNGVGDSIIALCLLFSACVCTYGLYELYKVYRLMNDPKNYRNKSRRPSN